MRMDFLDLFLLDTPCDDGGIWLECTICHSTLPLEYPYSVGSAWQTARQHLEEVHE